MKQKILMGNHKQYFFFQLWNEQWSYIKNSMLNYNETILFQNSTYIWYMFQIEILKQYADQYGERISSLDNIVRFQRSDHLN